jgi:methylated-DNA-[protein]-cysteine S-methyltransferase
MTMTTNGITPHPTYFTHVASPVGRLLLVAHGEALAGVYFEDHARGPRVASDWIDDPSRFEAAIRQLGEYFAGRRAAFDLPLAPPAPAATPFQRDVWTALRAIPYGTTITYAELARRVGRPGSARAVGHANARNPISIVVPCHRVVGADGSLTGYAGGEDRKRRLLALERDGARDRAATPRRGASAA